MGDDVMQIEIQGRLVGLVGLREAFDDLSRGEHGDGNSVRGALLERIEAVNYVPDGLREVYAEAVYRAYVRYCEGGEEEGGGRPPMTWRGIARNTIQWYPTVDERACNGCKRCIDFCSFSVFSYERDSDTVRVENPYACVVGCSLCMSICEPHAIGFPPLSYLNGLLKSRG